MQVLLVAALLAFTVSVVARAGGAGGFDTVLDGWVQCGAYVLTAVLVAVRPAVSRIDRRAWTLIAAALTCRAAAFVVFVTVVRTSGAGPAPSVADVGWVAMAVLLALGLVELARARFTVLSRTLVLDGAVGALGAAAVGVAVLDTTLPSAGLRGPGGTSGPLRPDVVLNLAYPVLDVLLLVLALGLLVASRSHVSRSSLLLACGVAGFAVVDTVFVVQQATGTFRPGTLLQVLSLAATTAIAWAAWVRDTRPGEGRRAWVPGIVVPAVASTTCLMLLVVASRADLPTASVVLAAAGGMTAIVRTTLSFRDVRAVAQARHDARTDDLTGVPNRRGFTEALEASLRGRTAQEPFGLLLVDLDQFKGVNELWGHAAGDDVLRWVAPRLRQSLDGLDLLARIGGDEFAVVLDGADHARAVAVARRLQAAVRRPIPVAGGAVDLTVSVGIALFPDDGDEATDLLQHADLALYAAKATRAGHARFQPDVHRARAERVDRVQRLRRAIDGGEIVVAYQPKVLLGSGQVQGVEALVRWQHPERGLLGPGEFLRHAENGGLMTALTQTVLEQAIGTCAAWRTRVPSFTVAVNLSVSDLLDERLPERVAALLARHRATGDALVLEITENLLMTDKARAEGVMSRLASQGVRFAIDDYGTGYSSLSYLRDLRHIAELKLDRSFVSGVCDDPRLGSIVRSTAALAAELDLEMVAEGVETVDVRDRLVELGCTVAQGFLFSRPVPAADVPLGRIVPDGRAAH